MALIDELQGIGNTGSVEQKIQTLKRARQALDTGELSISDYITFARPLAERVNSDLFQIAGSGSGGADAARGLLAAFQDGTGFQQDTADPRKLAVNLPDQFQQQLRRELLPENLSAEERAALENDIPFDIGFDSDRFKLEREAVRQKLSSLRQAGEARTQRKSALDDLAGFLAERDTDFLQNKALPAVQERLNAQGLLDSSELGVQVGRTAEELAKNREGLIFSAGLEDRDTNLGEVSQAHRLAQDLQLEGLSRQFSLDDFERNKQLGFRLAELQKPSRQGKSSGEKWAQGINAGANVIRAGAAAYGAGKGGGTVTG